MLVPRFLHMMLKYNGKIDGVLYMDTIIHMA
jgi:hypothetical protein